MALLRPPSPISRALALGDCSLAEDRFDEATAHYQRSIDLQVAEARNDYTLYRLGVTRQRKGDWGGGQSFYQLVLKRYPASPYAARIRERLALPARAFYLDAGTFASRRDAESLELHIRAHGREAQIVSGSKKGTFRVWAGGFPRYEAARDARPEYASICRKNLAIIP